MWPNGGVWVCYGALVRVRPVREIAGGLGETGTRVGLGEFVCRGGVVHVDVVVVELGERGVHVGMDYQVVQVSARPFDFGRFVEVVYGALARLYAFLEK